MQDVAEELMLSVKFKPGKNVIDLNFQLFKYFFKTITANTGLCVYVLQFELRTGPTAPAMRTIETDTQHEGMNIIQNWAGGRLVFSYQRMRLVNDPPTSELRYLTDRAGRYRWQG